MRSRKGLFWFGVILVCMGTVFVLLAWVATGSMLSWLQPVVPATFTPVAMADSAVVPSTATMVPLTATPEPLIPTATPEFPVSTATPAVLSSTGTPPPEPTHTPQPAPTTASPVPQEGSELWRGRPRWGIGGTGGALSSFDVAPLRLGWYLDWGTHLNPERPGDVEFVQMVRLQDGVLFPDIAAIAAVAQANPGALWLVGNEPDVRWQDNVEPVLYAQLYHQAYITIKGADPTAQVAIGGVSQPTPLRLRYLDAILAAYQEQFEAEMPLDVWNVHNFILREERDSWGVDIPPGMPDDAGMLYTIEDSGNLPVFRQQIVDFRQWMAERGYQNYPLIVSEYGIPMPADYGFPPERVGAFLIGTFDFFLTAADPTLGYPPDDHRLVQRWCWYSLADTNYPTGNLFDPATRGITPLGLGWSAYVEER